MAEQDAYIQKAYEKLEEISADEEKRYEYEARQKAMRDHRHMINSGIREGIRKGKLEGERIGTIKINTLIKKLLNDVRMEDLAKSIEDPEFQKVLLKEYNL